MKWISVITAMLVSGCMAIDPVTKKASLGEINLSLRSAVLELSFLWPEDFTTLGLVFNHEEMRQANTVNSPYAPLRILLDIRETPSACIMISKAVTNPPLPWKSYAPPSLAVLLDSSECSLKPGKEYTVRIEVEKEAKELRNGEVFIWWLKNEQFWKPYNEIGKLRVGPNGTRDQAIK